MEIVGYPLLPEYHEYTHTFENNASCRTIASLVCVCHVVMSVISHQHLCEFTFYSVNSSQKSSQLKMSCGTAVLGVKEGSADLQQCLRESQGVHSKLSTSF